MDAADFDYVLQLVQSRIGVAVKPGQVYLVESRLVPLARKLGMDSIADVVNKARANPAAQINNMIIDSMTTNETMFYRDRVPFEHLRKIILPTLIGKGRTIRIWCAACSTGQEPYSLAMMFDQQPELLDGTAVEIVATDVSDKALSQAREGTYSQFEVQRGLPLRMLMEYFTQEDDRWRIQDKLRNKITYMSHNLMSSPAHLGRFDIVLCRNVLIYFDKETKRKVLDGIATQMPPGGYLMLGSAETALGLTSIFRESPDAFGVYQRVAAAAIASGEAAA